MTVLIAPPVSTAKGIITHIPPDHVHPAFIAPRGLELACPNPQDFCALLAISVRGKLQNQWNAMQVLISTIQVSQNAIFALRAITVPSRPQYWRSVLQGTTVQPVPLYLLPVLMGPSHMTT